MELVPEAKETDNWEAAFESHEKAVRENRQDVLERIEAARTGLSAVGAHAGSLMSVLNEAGRCGLGDELLSMQLELGMDRVFFFWSADNSIDKDSLGVRDGSSVAAVFHPEDTAVWVPVSEEEDADAIRFRIPYCADSLSPEQLAKYSGAPEEALHGPQGDFILAGLASALERATELFFEAEADICTCLEKTMDLAEDREPEQEPELE
jgi:hypothetical protein